VTHAWEVGLAAERDAWRARLGEFGFTDNGMTLRGPVAWSAWGTGAVATIEVALTESFPFAPPQVRVLDPGVETELTFHQERDGSLCLWSSNIPVDEAPWLDPARLLERVGSWLGQNAAGWPGDDDCDLERYLPSDRRIVLYDREVLGAVRGCVRTSPGSNGQVVTITGEPQRPPARPQSGKRSRGKGRRHRRMKVGRKQRRLAWVADIGQVDAPITGWEKLFATLGPDADEVRRLVSLGVVEFVVLRYLRADAAGVLALSLRPDPKGDHEIRACESADTSEANRMLRAGQFASELVDRRVAVVGVGAVGSFVADLLFRHGIRQLTMIDSEILRPGNVVRHLAGEAGTGHAKVAGVKARLAGLGFDVSRVEARQDRLATPEQAVRLLRDHDLVVDATANGRATALLAWATDHIAQPVVSVCVQRQGGVVRVDRFPLRGAEVHLGPLSAQPEPEAFREHGCGELVSTTPPSAVVAAAELACRVAIDEVTRTCTMPATLLNILVSQEPPYDDPGLHLGQAR
jgi:molybdopterin/thiamine biosynthesis adenylyltransferase